MPRNTAVLSWTRVDDPSTPLGASPSTALGASSSTPLRASWIELELHRPPCNEIGSPTLDALEQFVEYVGGQHAWARAIIVRSSIPAGFCAGADLRELHDRMRRVAAGDRAAAVRTFLERIHRVLAAFDASPLATIAAVHGVTFGGGFEVALACDLIVADRTARFAFPELRLGLIPGFGGIPRLTRSVGHHVVQDLLLTGRSINASKALELGLVSQVAAPGEALALARDVARQIAKLDSTAVAAAKQLVKPRAPLTDEERRAEIDLFCTLCDRPEVEAALEKFVASSSLQPYLP
jgi:enoyl-CoA hydratase/carnithine racemase